VATTEADRRQDSPDESLPDIARLTLVGGVVVLAVTAATLALWEARTVMLLLFLAYTLGAAMRPGVDRLARAGVPRALALVGHFALFLALVVLLLWLIVPVAVDQTQEALADAPPRAETPTHWMVMGLDRPAAAEFSFFLAMPTMMAAFGHELLQVRGELSSARAAEISIGFLLAFVSSLVIIKPFLGFVRRSGFAPFAWYRIAVGALLLMAVARGWV